MKKILLLGGSRYIIPVIEAIHKLGYYAITCDYLPNNIAHKVSDEYYNVSIVDKEKVLELAKKINIDGIMSFACDPGVETAYYVAEKLGLPGHPYSSVEILQNKAKFRKFLTDNNFNVPKAKGYKKIEEALKDINYFNWPVIVKPVDSAGSKGVTKVEEIKDLRKAIEYAITFSKTESFIIEEFIEKKGYSSDSDCFSVNGKLVFASFSNQYFDKNAINPYTPSAYSWPALLPNETQLELKNELQRLMTLLNLKTSIYNIETRLGMDGKPYIMEVSPRGGGNRLSEMIRYSSETDLITNAVRACVGDEIVEINGDPTYKGYWAEVILHANEEGTFKEIWIDENISNYVYEVDLWINKGDLLHEFTGANEAIGTLVMNFDNKEKMEVYMNNVYDYIKVIVNK